MDWLIFWGIMAAYLAIGARRMPLYFKRSMESNKKDYPLTYAQDREQVHGYAAVGAIGRAAVWPLYEGARWVYSSLIHHMTAEERAEAEYKQAVRIVAEYKARKEREERDEFDRRLNEG